MNLRASIFIFPLLLIAACKSEFYSKKQLRTQAIPTALQNKTWTLRKIYSKKILHASMTDEFNNANGTVNCQFSFRFSEKGQLIMTFKQYEFKGVYVVAGDKFKFLHDGFKEQIVWNTNPECKITPTELGYVFNGNDEVDFKIEGKQLTLKNNTGDSFLLTTDN